MTHVTPQQFKQGLHGLGIRHDECLMVHSSLKSFGHFEGGPEAVWGRHQKPLVESRPNAIYGFISPTPDGYCS